MGSQGQTSESLPMQEIAVEFCLFRQQKIKNFSYKDDNGKLWVEVIIVTSLDSDDTVDVLTANDNDLNILYGIWVFHILLLLMVK